MRKTCLGGAGSPDGECPAASRSGPKQGERADGFPTDHLPRSCPAAAPTVQHHAVPVWILERPILPIRRAPTPQAPNDDPRDRVPEYQQPMRARAPVSGRPDGFSGLDAPNTADVGDATRWSDSCRGTAPPGRSLMRVGDSSSKSTPSSSSSSSSKDASSKPQSSSSPSSKDASSKPQSSSSPSSKDASSKPQPSSSPSSK